MSAEEALALVTRSDRIIAELAAGTVYIVVSVAALGTIVFLRYLSAMSYPSYQMRLLAFCWVTIGV
jgi:Mg2+/Co2+ transporter CorB